MFKMYSFKKQVTLFHFKDQALLSAKMSSVQFIQDDQQRGFLFGAETFHINVVPELKGPVLRYLQT